MEMTTKAITDLIRAVYNPRKTLKKGDPEYEALLRSITEFGYVAPVIWNQTTGHVVGGHQRLTVLADLGHKTVDVVVVNLSLEKEKALNLALNKISGDWDEQKLAAILENIQSSDVDVALTGFSHEEIQDLFDRILPADERQEDVDPEAFLDANGPAITQPGEIIELGGHRLMCGDSTDPSAVKQLMAGCWAALVATDPPYLVDYDGTNRPSTKPRGKAKAKENAWDSPDFQPELYKKFCQVALQEAAREDAAWYCFHASRMQSVLEEAWTAAGLFVHQQIIWVKERPLPGRSHYSWQHEPCFFGWKKSHQPSTVSSEKLSTVWELAVPAGKERPNHPTPKPVEAFCIPIRQHTVAGEICYEPFAGSGTQIIAAEKLGRRCFAMELSPGYCDLIVRRYIAYVGAANVNQQLVRRYRMPEVAHGNA